MDDHRPRRRFSEPTFLGGGVVLDRDSQTYIPYRWINGKMVTGEPMPFPETEQEMDRLQACADGGYQPPAPEERIVGFSIFQSVVYNAGNGYFLNGVPISDEEAQEIWERSPDNPKNKKPL